MSAPTQRTRLTQPPAPPPTLRERSEVIHLLYRAGVDHTLLTKKLIDALVYLFRGLDVDNAVTSNTNTNTTHRK